MLFDVPQKLLRRFDAGQLGADSPTDRLLPLDLDQEVHTCFDCVDIHQIG
jgi:hypothetical protein